MDSEEDISTEVDDDVEDYEKDNVLEITEEKKSELSEGEYEDIVAEENDYPEELGDINKYEEEETTDKEDVVQEMASDIVQMISEASFQQSYSEHSMFNEQKPYGHEIAGEMMFIKPFYDIDLFNGIDGVHGYGAEEEYAEERIPSPARRCVCPEYEEGSSADIKVEFMAIDSFLTLLEPSDIDDLQTDHDSDLSWSDDQLTDQSSLIEESLVQNAVEVEKGLGEEEAEYMPFLDQPDMLDYDETSGQWEMYSQLQPEASYLPPLYMEEEQEEASSKSEESSSTEDLFGEEEEKSVCPHDDNQEIKESLETEIMESYNEFLEDLFDGTDKLTVKNERKLTLILKSLKYYDLLTFDKNDEVEPLEDDEYEVNKKDMQYILRLESDFEKVLKKYLRFRKDLLKGKKRRMGVEIHLSDEDEEDCDVMPRRSEAFTVGMERANNFLMWAYRNKKKDKQQHVANKKKDSEILLSAREMRHRIRKYDLIRSNRVLGSIEDLPSVKDQIFLFKPIQDNTPRECYEAFSTGSIFLGTANMLGMNGHGTYIFPNGATYVGHFKNNIFHGSGYILYPNKTILEGTWFEGRLFNPVLTFSDGLKYEPNDWKYLRYPDRRFPSEIAGGLLSDNNPQLAAEHPARVIPEGCYDVGEGFYSTRTKCIHHPILGHYIRVPTKIEAKWITENCRSSADPHVPEKMNIYSDLEANSSPRFTGYKAGIKIRFSKMRKEERMEIVEEIAGKKKYLSKEELLNLCVPTLRNSPREYTKIKSICEQPPYRHNIPKFAMKLLNSKFDPNYLCPEEMKSSLIVKMMHYYWIKQFTLKFFIKTLRKTINFIIGKNICLSDLLEVKIKKMFKLFDQLKMIFILKSFKWKGYLQINEVDADIFRKAAIYWLQYCVAIKPKKFKRYFVQLLRRGRVFKSVPALEESGEGVETVQPDSEDSSVYPELKLYGDRNWTKATREKIKAQPYVIRTDSEMRN